MRKRNLSRVALVFLATASLLTAATPAWADNGFERDEYEVYESAGYVQLSVFVKFCCPMGQGQIDYHTSDLTAVAGQDYQQTSGTVTFVTGTYGRQDIRVPIFSDEFTEGEEQFEVKLTNFRGSFVDRGHETAVVKILDGAPEGVSVTYPSGGSNQSSGSRAGSSASSSLSSDPAAVAKSGDPSASVSPAAPTPAIAHEDPEGEPERALARAAGEDNAPPVGSAGLRALMVVMIVAAGLVLKMKFRRRATEG